MAYSKKEHLRDNIEALRLAFTKKPEELRWADRNALKKYSGFGGLKCVMQNASADSDIDQ